MSVDSACHQTLPCLEPSTWKDSRRPDIYGTEDNNSASENSSIELPQTDTDLHVHDSPDSSTSPLMEPPISTDSSEKKEDVKVQEKRQKMRTVFSQSQLCVLNARFQKQKYLTLQQMQELSILLNLSYKQVKTWFQNQRMKQKKWEKNSWPKNSSGVIQGSAPVGHPGHCANDHPRCLMNTPESLPAWNQTSTKSQSWDNLPSWNCQTWEGSTWSSQPWGTQSWDPQTCYPHDVNCPGPASWGEEPLRPGTQFQQNFHTTGLEINPETTGGSHLNFGTPGALDMFFN